MSGTVRKIRLTPDSLFPRRQSADKPFVNHMNQLRPLIAAAIILIAALPLLAQTQSVTYSDQENVISRQLRKLRDMPDHERSALTRKLAFDIRALPTTMSKVRLANALQNLSIEGDFGRDTLQEVTNTWRSQSGSMRKPEGRAICHIQRLHSWFDTKGQAHPLMARSTVPQWLIWKQQTG